MEMARACAAESSNISSRGFAVAAGEAVAVSIVSVSPAALKRFTDFPCMFRYVSIQSGWKTCFPQGAIRSLRNSGRAPALVILG